MDKSSLLEMLETQSEKIDNQVTKLSESNESLTIENQKLRKQVDILEKELNAKDQLIETTSGKCKELATQMKKELLNLRTENAHIKDEMTKLIKSSIEDKQNISQSLKR